MEEKTKAIILDLETSIKNRGEESIGTMKASPFHPDNNIVMYGWKWMQDGIVNTNKQYPYMIELNAPFILVGHNIKFDLLYLMTRHKWWRENLHNITIWDTQLAEYIISGQHKKFPSLDYCSEKYRGTLKDDKIKQYWEAGIDTEDIPEEELSEYLKHDVKNTELVFLEQMKRFHSDKEINFIMSQMDALKSTIEMEYNGMAFDKQLAIDTANTLQREYNVIEQNVKHYVSNDTGLTASEMDQISLNSNDVISALIFGGDIKYRKKVQVLDEDGQPVVFKTGKNKGLPKEKYQDFTVSIPINARIAYLREPAAKLGYYKVDEKKLKEVCDEQSNYIAYQVLELRKLKKDISTYFRGYSNLVWPDGCIHGSLHHCSTATGRLSSSRPNLQNVSGE